MTKTPCPWGKGDYFCLTVQIHKYTLKKTDSRCYIWYISSIRKSNCFFNFESEIYIFYKFSTLKWVSLIFFVPPVTQSENRSSGRCVNLFSPRINQSNRGRACVLAARRHSVFVQNSELQTMFYVGKFEWNAKLRPPCYGVYYVIYDPRLILPNLDGKFGSPNLALVWISHVWVITSRL